MSSIVVGIGATSLLWIGRSLVIKGVLYCVGFGPLGPIAGSCAAIIQAAIYGAMIPAGSIFAILQHFAMA